MVRRVHEMRTVTYHCDGCKRREDASDDESYPREWVKLKADAQALDGTTLLGTADVCPLCIRTKPLVEILLRWRAFTGDGRLTSMGEDSYTSKLPAYAEFTTKERTKP